jgi:hypothetical protein
MVRILLRVLLFVVLLLLILAPAVAAKAGPSGGSPPALTTLQPGGFQTISQDLTVNVVFVGYERGAGDRDLDEGAFMEGLPAGYSTISRYPALYGLASGLGLDFTYDYNLVYAGAAFEDAFFDYLDSIATDKPLTVFQSDYNGQAAHSVDVTDNCWIDAPKVEKWLALHALPNLGVDTSDYTVFFVNWYGRSDFRFHVYTKTGEVDPDTGYDFGLVRDSRKVIAWGGTTPDDEETGLGSLHRIWFYDLSAGPESWTDNWNVDVADLDGNGVMDYRMPPVWEYGNTAGYRPFDDLSGDLAKITRYVAVDLLFTTSALYRPAISPPRLPQAIQVDVNVYQADPAADGKQYIYKPLIDQELGELQPLNAFTTQLDDAAFAARAAEIYIGWLTDVTSFGNRLYGIAFADLFLYHQDQLLRFLDGDGDYEVPLFAYNLTDDLEPGGLLGFADDNWADGTQSYVFAFDTPNYRSLGYGFTTTIIHETGHHLGMSHPHDGYDSETGIDFGPGDDFYYAWAGDECNSIMNYMDLNWDFSQFDRDNMARYLTAVYINQANAILPAIYKSPRAGKAGSLLTSADGSAAEALSAYEGMDYAGAATKAKLAYDTVLAAAAAANVKVEPQPWQADYKAKGVSTKFVDPVDYHRNAP